MKIRNATILLGSTLTAMAGATISPTLPQIYMAFAEHPNADLLVRLVLTLPALFIAIFAPFMGYLLDNLGRKPVLLFSVVLYGIAGSSGFYLDSIEHILVSRALLGIAVAGIMSGFTTLIGDYFQGTDLARFMGKQSAFVAFGGVFFVIAGGFLTDVGWQYPFLTYVAALALIPSLMLTIHDAPHCPKMRKATPIKSINWLSVSKIYFIAFIVMALYYTIPVQFAFYLNTQSPTSGSMVGAILAASSLVTAFTSLQTHRIAATFSRSQIFVLAYASMALGFLIIGMGSNILVITLGALIFGLGVGGWLPNINVTLMMNVTPATRGKLVGGFTMAFFLGQFFSPLLSQPIISLYSIEYAFYAAAFIFMILALLDLTYSRNKSS